MVMFFTSLTGTPSLGRDAGHGAVLVEAHHGGEVLALHVGRVVHGDERVGVGRVAHHQHLAVAVGHGVERLALTDEDAAVLLEQVLALHAGPRGMAPTSRSHLRAREALVGVIAGFHAGERREGAVGELHHHALDGLHGRRDVDELQDDGLVFAEHLAGRDPEQESVANLTGRAGDGDATASTRLWRVIQVAMATNTATEIAVQPAISLRLLGSSSCTKRGARAIRASPPAIPSVTMASTQLPNNSIGGKKLGSLPWAKNIIPGCEYTRGSPLYTRSG
jgi:hypothetical protein